MIPRMKEFSIARGIPRPEGYMENPFIGKDGRDYHSAEALFQANKNWFERNNPKRIPNLLIIPHPSNIV